MEQQAAFGWAVDLVIIGAVSAGLISGFRRGALMQLFSWGGFVVGLFIGGLLAPGLVERFGPGSPAARAITGVVLFLGVAFITEALIAIAGGRLIRRINHDGVRSADRYAGSAIAAIMALLSAWVLSVPAKNSTQLAGSVRDSVILQVTHKLLPNPPDVIAGLGSLLNHTGFPEVFQQFNPSLAPGVDPAPKELENDREILAAARLTFKIQSRGCGGFVNGSGFSVTDRYVMTAAHVLAGTSSTEVLEPSDGGGRRFSATPVYLDAKKDIAVLRVNGSPGQMRLSSSPAERGQDGAAIGYPGGGNRRTSVARVRARTDAVGRDIYSRNTVSRQIYVMRAKVQQGNSGGPLVDDAGLVRGLVFAASADDDEESYALTETEIRDALEVAQGRRQAVKTGNCAI